LHKFIKMENEQISIVSEVEVEYASKETDVMENPFDPKRIDIKTKTTSLDNIIKRLKNDEIDLNTEFQRSGNLWDNTRQSRLIESLLIRFPIPVFYFDGSDDNRWLIVDGLQRLSSINNFVVNKSLKLQNLEYLKQFEGYYFDKLPRDLQRRIEETEIVMYIINPGTPRDVKFNLFKRINTSGLFLEPQEIRHALNQGIASKFVAELADLEEFKRATNYSLSSKRMLDRDFVTRFIAFYLTSYKDYKPDLDTFLNEGMAKLNTLSEAERQKLKTDFISAMNLAYEIFATLAFRKIDLDNNKYPLNKAVFETWAVCFAKANKSQKQQYLKYKKEILTCFQMFLIDHSEFLNAISSSTGFKKNVILRFQYVQKILDTFIND
jgi:hypothetical protein